MAVHKDKKSKSRRNMRRSHDALTAAALSIEPNTGEVHRRHNLSPDGWYRGRRIVQPKEETE
jgi:large subunit ribosomal protein L32